MVAHYFYMDVFWTKKASQVQSLTPPSSLTAVHLSSESFVSFIQVQHLSDVLCPQQLPKAAFSSPPDKEKFARKHLQKEAALSSCQAEIFMHKYFSTDKSST